MAAFLAAVKGAKKQNAANPIPETPPAAGGAGVNTISTIITQKSNVSVNRQSISCPYNLDEIF